MKKGLVEIKEKKKLEYAKRREEIIRNNSRITINALWKKWEREYGYSE